MKTLVPEKGLACCTPDPLSMHSLVGIKVWEFGKTNVYSLELGLDLYQAW